MYCYGNQYRGVDKQICWETWCVQDRVLIQYFNLSVTKGDTPTFAAGFWAEEWKTLGFWRRACRPSFWRKVPTAVGVSGTGNGDVSS